MTATTDTTQQYPFGDWPGFTPLADPPHAVALSDAARALLGDPDALLLTGDELLGCGLFPGDILIIDRADRQPEPGALVVVWGGEDDPNPGDLPPSLADLPPAIRAQIITMRPVPIVGQYWPIEGAIPGERDARIGLRAVLPGRPMPLVYMGKFFDDELIGVVCGDYATGKRGGKEVTGIDCDKYDWTGWDWGAALDTKRGHMKALAALHDFPTVHTVGTAGEEEAR